MRSFSQLRPASTSANSGPQAEQRPRVGLEAVELRAGQNAVEGIREQAVKLVTLHSVTGWFWHHITCL